MVRRAIDCYASQDYQPRELVIVSDGEEDYEDLRRYAAARCASQLTMRAVAQGSKPLGALRNAAIELAHGEIVCQWDDDDLSHPRRISAQVEMLQSEDAVACFLTDQLHLMARDRQLYWCDWARPRGWPLPSSTIPNTLLCRKACATGGYPEAGPLSRRSEDAYFMRRLLTRAKVARLSGHGWLYVYVCHGTNTWHESHHLDIVHATGMDAADLIRREGELKAHVASYPLGELVVSDWLGSEVYRVVTRDPAAHYWWRSSRRRTDHWTKQQPSARQR